MGEWKRKISERKKSDERESHSREGWERNKSEKEQRKILKSNERESNNECDERYRGMKEKVTTKVMTDKEAWEEREKKFRERWERR